MDVWMKNLDNSHMIIVDIYFAKELCFERVSKTIPVPVRDIDLYMNRENY